MMCDFWRSFSEVAISDSRGLPVSERWAPLAEAEQVGQKCFFVVGW
jgi:hypothetical protein